MYDPDKCATCKYSIHNNGEVTCDYILVTGKRRGCYDGDECVRYEKREHDRRICFFLGGNNGKE